MPQCQVQTPQTPTQKDCVMITHTVPQLKGKGEKDNSKSMQIDCSLSDLLVQDKYENTYASTELETAADIETISHVEEISCSVADQDKIFSRLTNDYLYVQHISQNHVLLVLYVVFCFQMKCICYKMMVVQKKDWMPHNLTTLINPTVLTVPQRQELAICLQLIQIKTAFIQKTFLIVLRAWH